jgi:hypothetical protein
MHLARQAVSVSVRKNENKSNPVTIAPTMLVATNSTARRSTARNTVAIIAPRSTKIVVFRQQGLASLQQPTDADITSTTARYTTAIPKTVHKNAGVTVIAAVILRKAVTIPITILIISAMVVHVLFLHEQSLFDIFSPPTPLYVSLQGVVRSWIAAIFR